MSFQALKRTVVLVAACFAGCQARAQAPTPEFSKVFKEISSEHVFSSSFATILTKLEGLCTERQEDDADFLKKGNVSCVEAAAVNRLTLSGSEDPSVSMVQSSFRNIEQCSYMKGELIRRYGKPQSNDGKCGGEWRITVGKKNPPRLIRIKVSKETGLVYFTYQEEQGP
jgi:hypothetical protein